MTLWSESVRIDAKFMKWNLDIGNEWSLEWEFLHKKCDFFSLRKLKAWLSIWQNEVKTGLVGQIPRSLRGCLVKDLWGNEGELDMLPLLCNQTTTLTFLSLMRWVFFDKTKVSSHLASATSNYLPSLIRLTSSLPFDWVHLD